MKRKLLIASCFAILTHAPAVFAVAPYTPDIPGNWHVVYDNEFNDNSTATDLANWTYDIGNGQSEGIPGWGNNELEYYTNSSSNVNVSTTNGVGALNINAIRQSTDGYSYSSGRIQSTNAFSQTYGVIEFRAQLPVGQGLWPAVWMLPENAPASSAPVYGSWPTSGEIDILESTGQASSLVQGSLHSGANYNQADNQTLTFANSGQEPAGFSTTAWHTYDLEWDAGSANTPGSIKWYVDGQLYETQTGGWYVPSSAPYGDKEAPFDQPFYLLINLAVGGSYAGTPNLAANTPYTMSIDYIRSYSPYVLGDTNNDGVVNSTDLATLMSNYGKSVTTGFAAGDFNNDGIVNADDLALFQLGVAQQSVPANSVPEPASVILLALPVLFARNSRKLNSGRRDGVKS